MRLHAHLVHVVCPAIHSRFASAMAAVWQDLVAMTGP